MIGFIKRRGAMLAGAGMMAGLMLLGPALSAPRATEPRGRALYLAHCAACHGADLKGLADQHTPNLTDAAWLFSGDDLESGGITMFPADVEKTVLYGVRSGHPKARNEASMPGFGPIDRNLLTENEIGEVADHVLTLAGRAPSSAASAARGKAVYADKGNCWDCHSDDGMGNGALGATDFTRDLWLYGGDRAALIHSITLGRAGRMPAFEGLLTANEIKTVSRSVFEQAAPP